MCPAPRWGQDYDGCPDPRQRSRRGLYRRQRGRAVRCRAQAAAQAEATKHVSKFGRAKSYGTKTIGTPDAGAVSMSWFFQGLARE
ncbi:MAG: DAK2 domain-containing protein [Dysosmobacter welbionis]